MLDKNYYLLMPLLVNIMPCRYDHLPNVSLDCSGLPNFCHSDNTCRVLNFRVRFLYAALPYTYLLPFCHIFDTGRVFLFHIYTASFVRSAASLITEPLTLIMPFLHVRHFMCVYVIANYVFPIAFLTLELFFTIMTVFQMEF